MSSSRDDAHRKVLVADLKELLPEAVPNGSVSLWDIELDPDFDHCQYIYVCYVHPGEGRHTRVSRLTLDGKKPLGLVPDSERVLIRWPAGGHNAGCLEFGPDKYLYISTGDGSGPNPPDGLTTGQDVSDLLGAILRIDVNHPEENRPYSIPNDKPVRRVGRRAARKSGDTAFEIRGRSESIERRATSLPPTTAGSRGNLSIGLAAAVIAVGRSWKGRAALRTEVAPGPTPIVPPIKDHPHSEANSVIGGPVYRGAKLGDLDGAFIYGGLYHWHNLVGKAERLGPVRGKHSRRYRSAYYRVHGRKPWRSLRGGLRPDRRDL